MENGWWRNEFSAKRRRLSDAKSKCIRTQYKLESQKLIRHIAEDDTIHGNSGSHFHAFQHQDVGNILLAVVKLKLKLSGEYPSSGSLLQCRIVVMCERSHPNTPLCQKVSLVIRVCNDANPLRMSP